MRELSSFYIHWLIEVITITLLFIPIQANEEDVEKTCDHDDYNYCYLSESYTVHFRPIEESILVVLLPENITYITLIYELLFPHVGGFDDNWGNMTYSIFFDFLLNESEVPEDKLLVPFDQDVNEYKTVTKLIEEIFLYIRLNATGASETTHVDFIFNVGYPEIKVQKERENSVDINKTMILTALLIQYFVYSKLRKKY